MIGLVIKMRLVTVIPPVLRIEVNSDYDKTLTYSMSKIFKFMTKEKTELLSFDDDKNEYDPYPEVEGNYPMGICVYALFNTQSEALEFIKRFKENQ